MSRREKSGSHGEESSAGSKKTSSNRIEIIHKGPVHICTSCFALLSVPEKLIRMEQEETEEGTLLVASYICPSCNEESIMYEQSDDEEETEKRK